MRNLLRTRIPRFAESPNRSRYWQLAGRNRQLDRRPAEYPSRRYRCQSGLISLGKLNKNISKIAGQAIPYSGLPSPNAEKLIPHWDLVKTGNRSYAVS